MARVDLPESRLRARRKRRRARVALVFVMSALVCVGGLVGATYLPLLQVSAVEVSGAQTLATSTVEEYMSQEITGRYWYLFPKRNIFLYPKRAIEQGLLARYPELRAARVHAVNFHTIEAAVVEREPKAKWCTDDVCYLMDQTGVVYASGYGVQGLVSYWGKANGEKLPKQYLTPEGFESLFALVDALSQKPDMGAVVSVVVDPQDDVSARFDNGFNLKFALGDAGGDVFERFSLALESEPYKANALSDFEYLDLRFGDKLYYKLK